MAVGARVRLGSDGAPLALYNYQSWLRRNGFRETFKVSDLALSRQLTESTCRFIRWMGITDAQVGDALPPLQIRRSGRDHSAKEGPWIPLEQLVHARGGLKRKRAARDDRPVGSGKVVGSRLRLATDSGQGRSITAILYDYPRFHVCMVRSPNARVDEILQPVLRSLGAKDIQLGTTVPELEFMRTSKKEDVTWQPFKKHEAGWFAWWPGQVPYKVRGKAAAQRERNVLLKLKDESLTGAVRWLRGVQADAKAAAAAGTGHSWEQHRALSSQSGALSAIPEGLALLPDAATGFDLVAGGCVLETKLGLFTVGLQVYHCLEYLLAFVASELGEYSKARPGVSSSAPRSTTSKSSPNRLRRNVWLAANLRQQIEELNLAKEAGRWRLVSKRMSRGGELFLVDTTFPLKYALIAFHPSRGDGKQAGNRASHIEVSGEKRLFDSLGCARAAVGDAYLRGNLETMVRPLVQVSRSLASEEGLSGKRVLGSMKHTESLHMCSLPLPLRRISPAAACPGTTDASLAHLCMDHRVPRSKSAGLAISRGSIKQDLAPVYAAMDARLRRLATELGLPLLPVETVPSREAIEAWLAFDFSAVSVAGNAALLAALAERAADAATEVV